MCASPHSHAVASRMEAHKSMHTLGIAVEVEFWSGPIKACQATD